jgi:integral membrane protein
MNQIKNLRLIGIAEGISFFVLLLIAMPLKYYWGFPLAVKVVGWAHGLLFILYIVAVVAAIPVLHWSFIRISFALLASVVPGGPFVLDKYLKRRIGELSQL